MFNYPPKATNTAAYFTYEDQQLQMTKTTKQLNTERLSAAITQHHQLHSEAVVWHDPYANQNYGAVPTDLVHSADDNSSYLADRHGHKSTLKTTGWTTLCPKKTLTFLFFE